MLTFALATLLALALPATEPDAGVPAPAATAAPVIAGPREPLREIGTVRAQTPFCKAFLAHFNGSARAMLGIDETLTFVDFTLGGLESHFKAKAGELLLYDDRVRLIHYTGDIFKTISALQDEIDSLRRSADLTTDAQQAKEARAAATELQKSLDRQRAMADDSLNVVHALMDLALGTTANISVQSKLGGPPTIAAPEVGGPSATTDYTGGTAANMDYSQSTPAERRDVRSYLQFSKQFDKIGVAESAAVAHARTVADHC